jgi:peptide methionine sulfoxide reductase msrA/msrB
MDVKDSSLTQNVLNIIRLKATETPHTGEYNLYKNNGTYLCRACGVALFRADNKFASGCGWPSFDVTIPGAVIEIPDKDKIRMEIICAFCNAHLGHVFNDEGFTFRNRRFCVNSLSLDFVENTEVVNTEEAIVAGGCFWGIQYLIAKQLGILKTEVGYIGGTKLEPSYDDVCSGSTGHFEAVRVLYSPLVTNYETVLKYFFEIHDPTQRAGQGPDIGSQYQSAVFYHNYKQQKIAEKLITILKQKGFELATQILPMQIFWRAEEFHQDYYFKNDKLPYCHRYEKRF